jgi:glycosyltransferase involved in cell wall biosynthesis
MTDLPRISVALCVHNGARWLPEQLDSLLAQEGVALEIVALDDRSTDESLDVLWDYAGRDDRIRVATNLENLGHLKSFEKCMALCVAPLIAPCDQDDVWHPRKLAKLAAAIGDADLAYCDSAYIDGAGRSLGRRVSQDIGPMQSGRDPLRYVFQNTVSGHALLVRRDVFNASLPLPALLYHDWWLAMRAAAGRGVVYVDEPLVQFRRHDMAYSPMGKSDSGLHRKRSSSRNRKWIAQWLYIFEQLLYVDWFPRGLAVEWHAAMRAAESGRIGPLLPVIWRSRRSVPPDRGPRWWAALRFWLKCANKVERARRERAFEGPLFK